jgi:Uma2 family endonuclease
LLLKPRTDYYASKKVWADDALLVVEVADTTLQYDRNMKVPRYAAAGVPEVWIENLPDDELLVYRDPSGEGYAVSMTLHRGDSVSPVAFPDVVFKIEELLG